jgi:hypothetical protein
MCAGLSYFCRNPYRNLIGNLRDAPDAARLQTRYDALVLNGRGMANETAGRIDGYRGRDGGRGGGFGSGMPGIVFHCCDGDFRRAFGRCSVERDHWYGNGWWVFVAGSDDGCCGFGGWGVQDAEMGVERIHRVDWRGNGVFRDQPDCFPAICLASSWAVGSFSYANSGDGGVDAGLPVEA